MGLPKTVAAIAGNSQTSIAATARFVHPRTTWAVAFVLCWGCYVCWHAHGIAAGGFQNLDVAGIVYNARLLLAGRLPYVDSIEIKPPGAFLLFAPWLALGGLKAVWCFSTIWGAATSLSTGWLGALCWGSSWGPCIAVLHAAGAGVAADGDINYSFWMTLPCVLSAIAALRAAREVRSGCAWGWLAISSALATFAILVRPTALPIVLLLVASVASRLRTRPLATLLQAASAGGFGVVAMLTLVALPFLHGGSLQAMIRGYFSVRQYAGESVGSVVTGAGGRLAATLDGLQCLPDQVPVYYLLLAIALVPTRSISWSRWLHSNGLFAWIFALTSLVGISLTLRFFTHDNAPAWAAFAVLILRPASPIGMVLVRFGRNRWLQLGLSLALGAWAPFNNWKSLTGMQHHLHESDNRVGRLCERLQPYLSRQDTVLAWGWTAWGVYEHCGRWAPGPIYKDLTTVTTPNTNTCNRGYDPPRLKPGPLAQRYLRDLQQRRPALILVSDYYRGLGGDPLDEWFEARQFMRDNYVVFDTPKGFTALLRHDLNARIARPSPTLDAKAAENTDRVTAPHLPD